ncbi:hypothetical protein GGR51DRAFT_514934 [Nemania sp. FL0031]|nr:hypothetical protein GGR51DRAFT_514934 [Nemania sp. FL0031]
MSGVRNLRAMFEQKGDNLPDRGRSPGPGGLATPSPSASPRPLSKVRTSFVAIEKDGRIGLRREPSRDSVSVSSRRLSDETDTTIPQPISEKSDVFSDNMASTVASFKTNLSHEAIPESPSQDIPAKVSAKKELKSPPLAPNANPDKFTDEEESRTKMLPSDTTASSAARLGGTVLNGGAGDALNGMPSTTTKAKAPSATKATSKTVAPVSTAKTTARAPKSPMVARVPNAKEPSKPASSSTNPKKATSTKTTASKPAAIDLPPSGTGFVKPKPKSPTRPVKLPSSLTTHTASSAQKLGNGNAAPAGRQSLSRASGNLHNLSVNPTTHRSPSRNSVSTIGTTTTKTLKHQPSSANVGRSRPSLGPPPKPVAKEVPAKRESQVDESFLARMMRPTESSAKKTAEKTPLTPPRKRSAPIKKPEIKEAEKNVKKVVAKAPSSSAQAKTAKSTAKPVVAKETVPAAAQAETTDAVSEEAKTSTDVETPLVKDDKVDAEPAVEVVQEKVAENSNKVEEAIDTSTGTAITADVPPTEESEIVEVQAAPEPVTSSEADVIEPVEPVVPAVTEDPLKVEDIEDVVQEVEEVEEVDQEPQPTEPVVEVSQPEDIEAKESVTISAAEPKVDVEGPADEPPKQEERVADVKETTSEEVAAESSVTTPNSPDVRPQDLLEEAIIKDASAAAL